MLRAAKKLNLLLQRNAVSAVIFDMGGVILPSPNPAINKFEASNGIPKNTVLKTLAKNGNSSNWCRLERGEVTPSEFEMAFSNELSDFLGKSVSATGLVKTIEAELSHPIQDTLDAISSLKKLNIPVALLTNNWKSDDSSSSFQPFIKQFDVVVESATFGERKPHPSIYEEVIQRLKISPEEAVFLDDIGGNLKAANKVGIQTIKVTGGHPQNALHELQNLIGKPLVNWPKGTTPIRPGMHLNEEKIAKFLREKLGLSGPLEMRQFDHGQSNPTYYLKVGDEELVLRKKPDGKLLRGAHMVEREYQVMKALGAAGVPVPEMLILHEETEVCGTPFYIMKYLRGRIFKDGGLKDVPKDQRKDIYKAVVEALAKVHSVDPIAAGLKSYGKLDGYIARQVKTWGRQYKSSETSTIETMDKLMSWLPANVPEQTLATSVVQGDFRVDNCIFHPTENRVIAVLDWELSTLGDPISDLSYMCMQHYLPSGGALPGLADLDLEEEMLPAIDEIVAHYAATRKVSADFDLDYYLAFCFFRLAAIGQGVYKRGLEGNASNRQQALAFGNFVPLLAEMSWNCAEKSMARKEENKKEQKRTAKFITSPEEMRPYALRFYKDVREFVQEEVIPMEQRLIAHEAGPDRWSISNDVETLKAKAKAAGLWNLFVPLETDPDMKWGKGLTNLEYAFMAEEMGNCLFGSEPFNCSPPDTGNMEVLMKYGTPEQQNEWLSPLLEGTIRSCFGMTEPDVASSDATNIESSIVRDGDFYILNGKKWWTSMAMHPNNKVCIFMGKTDFDAVRHRQQSMILCPMDAPGVKIVRPLSVYGSFDAPAGHAELHFENVRVPASNLLLGEGEGFTIAQGRLGPGRIHHCMRLIGHCERSMKLMKTRLNSRIAFGKPLAAQGVWQERIGLSRISIDQARLMTLLASHKMDTVGNKVAAKEIAMIKVIAPKVAEEVIDRAIQAHGAAGLSQDFPLAGFMTWARILRLADGPDEVHVRAVSRIESKN